MTRCGLPGSFESMERGYWALSMQLACIGRLPDEENEIAVDLRLFCLYALSVSNLVPVTPSRSAEGRDYVICPEIRCL